MKNGSAKRRSWSEADIKSLKTMSRRKAGAKEAAKALRRTMGATRQKAHSLGIPMTMG